jgi:hypothetical protein
VLPFVTVHTITAWLIDTEITADDTGWDTPPALLALADRPPIPGTDTGRRLLTTTLPIPEHWWTEHPTGIAGLLTDLATVLREPSAQWLFGYARDQVPGLRVLAWAVVYTDITITPTCAAQTRHVDAVDLDGRQYQIVRTRDNCGGVAVVDDQPRPGDEPATRTGLAGLIAASNPGPSRTPAT